MDQYSGLGIDLYDDNTVNADPSLLSGLVGALMLFTSTLSEDFHFERAEIGPYSLSVNAKNDLLYVCFSDSSDNDEFIQSILIEISDIVSERIPQNDILEIDFDVSEFRNAIQELIATVNFPVERIPELEKAIDILDQNSDIVFRTVILTDVNKGLIHSYRGEQNDVIYLLKVAKKLPFDKTWIGESRKFMIGKHVAKESFLVVQLAESNFFLASQILYKPNLKERAIELFDYFVEMHVDVMS